MRTWLYKFRGLSRGERVPAVFLHIQKTAGTSLVNLAARHYGQENIITHSDYIGRTPESLTSIPFVSGHFGYDYAKDLIRTRKSFTFLRNPTERILSLYYFCRSQDPNLFPMYRIAHECTLSEFLRRGLEDPYMRARLWNNQTWQLAHGYGATSGKSLASFSPDELIGLALEHTRKFSFIGLTENYDADARKVAELLGWSAKVDDVHENVSSGRKSAKNVSDEEAALLKDLTALDEILYQHVKMGAHANRLQRLKSIRHVGDQAKKRNLVPALFLHIQRTAGASIVQSVVSHYGGKNIMSHGDYIGKKPNDFVDVPFVSGHFGYTFAKPLMVERYSFTFLRDPIERVLSFYYFCRSKDPNEAPIYRMAHSLTLENFLKTLSNDRTMRWFVYNSQVWYLACGPGDDRTRVNYMTPRNILDTAVMNMNTFSHVGFMETFEDDSKIIMEALGVPSTPTALVKANVTERDACIDHISTGAMELINDLTQLDQMLYEVAWQRRC